MKAMKQDDKKSENLAPSVGSSMRKLLTTRDLQAVSGGAWRKVPAPRPNPGSN